MLTGRQDVGASNSASCTAPQLDDQLPDMLVPVTELLAVDHKIRHIVGVMVMMLAEWLPVITQDAQRSGSILSVLVLSTNLEGSGTVPTHANYDFHACTCRFIIQVFQTPF